ncbi:L,D-transpeptidase family protein [Streptomyces zhihengii]|uniref:L,D-transpeptidase family protein n=1 Tax=Streptomyces zhihengii TaxID=1818004 RepID=A0ABS2USX8_9ACTN|nr:L,D-transpeptidase family protein [Streptomyces zhihengii]MBM9620398.1 L,D-transpeptidase family protein [Streptomyces zhihengii]
MSSRIRTLSAVVLLCAGALLTGCGDTSGTGPAPGADAKAVTGARGEAPAAAVPQTLAVAEIPGIGPRTRAGIPADARQVFVVTGSGPDADESTAALYRHDADKGWQRTAGPWPAHNALRGWTDDHRQGDLRSPIGVYGLTDAGGLLPDPGTELPYDRQSLFSISGRGFEGEPLEGSFDYVVAVNYNREAGTTPLDPSRPLGDDKGGGIWIHVDHGGPTQGCVSLDRDRMKELLRALDPELRPVVVMGPAGTLAR